MKKYLILLVFLLTVSLHGLALGISSWEQYAGNQPIGQLGKLFPVSWYTYAVEICMRVLEDCAQKYDPVTASDLCVGRLVRLSGAVKQIELIHCSKKPYPPEDLSYIIGLMGIAAKERQQNIQLSQTALNMFGSIESRMELLLRHQ